MSIFSYLKKIIKFFAMYLILTNSNHVLAHSHPVIIICPEANTLSKWFMESSWSSIINPPLSVVVVKKTLDGGLNFLGGLLAYSDKPPTDTDPHLIFSRLHFGNDRNLRVFVSCHYKISNAKLVDIKFFTDILHFNAITDFIGIAENHCTVNPYNPHVGICGN
jgi:hypothetical protein